MILLNSDFNVSYHPEVFFRNKVKGFLKKKKKKKKKNLFTKTLDLRLVT